MANKKRQQWAHQKCLNIIVVVVVFNFLLLILNIILKKNVLNADEQNSNNKALWKIISSECVVVCLARFSVAFENEES